MMVAVIYKLLFDKFWNDDLTKNNIVTVTIVY